MAIEFTVILENKPGTLAQLGHVLGEARVNIDAIHQMSNEQGSVVQFVPSDAVGAEKALTDAGVAFTRREVLVVDVLDQPGTLGDVAMVMADAGVNIDSLYVTNTAAVIFGVDDLDGGKQVTAGMAVHVHH
jgi:hypothetical protein